MDDEDFEEIVNDEVEKAVDEVLLCVCEELQDILSKKRTCWVKDWVVRRNNLGASSTIIRELAEEDPMEFKKSYGLAWTNFLNFLI